MYSRWTCSSINSLATAERLQVELIFKSCVCNCVLNKQEKHGKSEVLSKDDFKLIFLLGTTSWCYEAGKKDDLVIKNVSPM